MNDLLAAEGGEAADPREPRGGRARGGPARGDRDQREHVLALLEAGEAARHTGETRMNKASSRSHTIFRMVRARLRR